MKNCYLLIQLVFIVEIKFYDHSIVLCDGGHTRQHSVQQGGVGGGGGGVAGALRDEDAGDGHQG